MALANTDNVCGASYLTLDDLPAILTEVIGEIVSSLFHFLTVLMNEDWFHAEIVEAFEIAAAAFFGTLGASNPIDLQLIGILTLVVFVFASFTRLVGCRHNCLSVRVHNTAVLA